MEESKCESREPKLVFESKRKWNNSMMDKDGGRGDEEKIVRDPLIDQI